MKTIKSPVGCECRLLCWLSQYLSQVRYQQTRLLILSLSSSNLASERNKLMWFTQVSISFMHFSFISRILFRSQRVGATEQLKHSVEFSERREMVLEDLISVDPVSWNPRQDPSLQDPPWHDPSWHDPSQQDPSRQDRDCLKVAGEEKDSLLSRRATSSLEGALATWNIWDIITVFH